MHDFILYKEFYGNTMLLDLDTLACWFQKSELVIRFLTAVTKENRNSGTRIHQHSVQLIKEHGCGCVFSVGDCFGC